MTFSEDDIFRQNSARLDDLLKIKSIYPFVKLTFFWQNLARPVLYLKLRAVVKKKFKFASLRYAGLRPAPLAPQAFGLLRSLRSK